MKKFKMFELTGSNACNKGRSFGMKAEEKRRENYDKAIAVKAIVEKAMFEGLTEDELKEMIEEKFEKITYNELEREAHKKDAFPEIQRYLDYELLKNRCIVKAVPVDVEVVPGLMEIKVTPDLVVLDPTPQLQYTQVDGKWEYLPYAEGVIEIVKIKTGKPISGIAAQKDIGLYSMLQYGKKFVKPGSKAVIKASYYFLRQNEDKPAEGKFDDFGEKNIRSMTDIYEGTGTETILDKRMKMVCEDFFNGHDDTMCTKADCQDCVLYDICKGYSDGPIAMEGELKRKAADIQFTPAQTEAIEYSKGIVRINAGAGSGKTLVVVFRVITLMFNGVKPEEILLISFTNTAAAEMRERIKLYAEDWGLEADLDKLKICTFHAFGNDILHEKYAELGFSKEPHVIDEIERSRIIADLLNKHKIPGLDYRNFTMKTKYALGALATAKKGFRRNQGKRLRTGRAQRDNGKSSVKCQGACCIKAHQYL
jgi:Superfamily I DNA and RNA helicases